MCGIAGVFESRLLRPGERSVLQRMASALEHRGPDDQGLQCGDHWGLASRRLSIIGVDSGHQPLSNEDGTVWVAFNGEIYNHLLLRDALGRRGHVFSSATDTEVLVHLYEEHGDRLVDHLAGMFAFALIDVPKRRLLLARDRLGQKPLVYSVTPEGTLVFASELQALRCHPSVGRDLDLAALQDYLSLGYIPAPRTIYAGVAKLPPASVLTVSYLAERAEVRRYWQAPFTPKQDLPFAEAVLRTRELLDAAVRRRLESEVPLGAFLSGGLDSTAIAAIMQQHLGEPVNTFTIGFDDPAFDERNKAQAAAEFLGTRHAAQVADVRDVSLLRRIVRHCGEPFCDSSILPTAILSRFARTGVTVALSGDGGDELFGGYERYRVMALHRLVARLSPPSRRALCDALLTVLPEASQPRTHLMAVRRVLGALREDTATAYMGFQGVFSRDARAALCAGPLAATSSADRVEEWEAMLRRGTAADAVEACLELDLLEYLPGDLLVKVDLASMMFSLEVRSPFLDHELVEFVARLPRAYKVTLRRRKHLLAAAVADLLPPGTASQAKRGFGVPIAAWLRHGLADAVREMVLWQRDWDRQGCFDGGELRRLAEEHLNGSRDHSFQLWALFCLKLWVEEVQQQSP